MPPHTVFVSSVAADAPLCLPFVTGLRARGLDVWYQPTPPGTVPSVLSADIERELKARSALVVMLSPAAVESHWVKLEIDAYRALAASDPHRLVIPVRVAPCEIPLLLHGIKAIDATNQPLAASIEELAVALGAGTSTEPSAPPQGGSSTPYISGPWARAAGAPIRPARFTWWAVLGALLALVLLTPIALNLRGHATSTRGTNLGSPGIISTISGAATFTPAVSIPTPASLTLQITEFPVLTRTGMPSAIVRGPDGALWFTDGNAPKVGRISTAGSVREYTAPGFVAVTNIAIGPDKALWFVGGAHVAGHITTGGTLTEIPIPAFAYLITVAPTGAMWFDDPLRNKLVLRSPSGNFTTFPVPDSNLPGSYNDALGLAAAPDGSLWFIQTYDIAHITTSGVTTIYPIPSRPQFSVSSIAIGPDGGIWFTEGRDTHAGGGGQIGLISASGQVTEFPAISTIGNGPRNLTVGPDGALWFSEWDISFSNSSSPRIGRITTTGQITQFPISIHGCCIGDITAGPDGALWFTDTSGWIGRAKIVRPA